MLETEGRRDELLQQCSLHIPKSILLSRFEASLDDLSLCTLVQSRIAGEPQSGSPARIDGRDLAVRPFGFSSFLKFESLHNFDLGLTVQKNTGQIQGCAIGTYYSKISVA